MARERITLDRYYTPDWASDQMARLVLPKIVDVTKEPLNVLEPSCGEGSIVKAIARHYPHARIVANDIDSTIPVLRDAAVQMESDFLKVNLKSVLEAGGVRRFDVAVGNPPYLFAEDFVRQALRISNHVVYLLRQGFMSSAKRSRFFQTRTPVAVDLLANRPAFREDTSSGDMTDYCWISWSTVSKGWAELRWLPAVPLEHRKMRYE